MTTISKNVRNALDLGATAMCDGLAAVQWFRFVRRPSDPGPHFISDVWAGDRHVQIYVSPTGRSVRVYVDGREVVKTTSLA